jgi:hypothetical protein
MNTTLTPSDLKRSDTVFYLGDTKLNQPDGWGKVYDIIPGTSFLPAKIIVDMGKDYPFPDLRIKIVPYHLFQPGPFQQFKTPVQLETERQQKNDSLNNFYNSINRTTLSIAI